MELMTPLWTWKFRRVLEKTQDLYHLPIAINQSVQLTKCNMKFDISRWLTIMHSSLIHWYRNLSIHRYIGYTMSDRITHLEWCVMSILERISKFSKKCALTHPSISFSARSSSVVEWSLFPVNPEIKEIRSWKQLDNSRDR